jgi:hypothetical protein
MRCPQESNLGRQRIEDGILMGGTKVWIHLHALHMEILMLIAGVLWISFSVISFD